ncbi:CvpA family protein [Congregibacter litoralis]|uniref:Putative membrane protein, required for colicin V production n=1 Tax=Congregibacter litoralis KT71 TaxID=314285 RepID=A4A849_9GAMM|nr:CvpA family protein [Congregibacter litoralis]EAQ97844.1 putative membrane protein, required for colicin V production [Congregibacter litoralis KT71]
MTDWPNLGSFNAFDWIVVVIIVLSALLSLWRGFVREAISLAGWVVAFIVANLLAVTVADQIGDLIANRTGRYIVAWSLLFVLTLVASSLSAKLFASLIKASGLGVLDRLLGTVFGVLRGALIVMALVFVVREIVPKSEQSLLADSELMPHIDVLLSWSMRIFDEFRDVEIKGLNA